MAEVIQSLERHFDIEIKVANDKILNCRANGTYPDPLIDNMLEVLEFMLILEVTKQDGQYVLNGEGC